MDRGSTEIGSTEKAIQESFEARATRSGANGLSGAFEHSPSSHGEGRLGAIGEAAFSRPVKPGSSPFEAIHETTNRSRRDEIDDSSVHETHPPQVARA